MGLRPCTQIGWNLCRLHLDPDGCKVPQRASSRIFAQPPAVGRATASWTHLSRVLEAMVVFSCRRSLCGQALTPPTSPRVSVLADRTQARVCSIGREGAVGSAEDQVKPHAHSRPRPAVASAPAMAWPTALPSTAAVCFTSFLTFPLALPPPGSPAWGQRLRGAHLLFASCACALALPSRRRLGPFLARRLAVHLPIAGREVRSRDKPTGAGNVHDRKICLVE